MARKVVQPISFGRANSVVSVVILGLMAGLLLTGCSNRQELNWADYYKVAKAEKTSHSLQPGSFGSGQAFGSGMMPFGSGAMPYGSGMPFGSGAMPYGSGAPFGSGVMPFGSGMPYGSGAMPFGSGPSIMVPARSSAVSRFPAFGSPYPTN